MASLNPKDLKSQANARLENQNPKKMILIFTGITVLLNLLASGLTLYLDHQIESTGGLSGLGARSVLETVQTVLQYATMIFTPFWTAGLTAVALNWADHRNPQPKDLLSGFKRFSSVLSYECLRMFIYFGVGMACSYVASLIFTLTPFSDSLVDILETAMVSDTLDLTALDTMPLGSLVSAYLPLLLIDAAIMIPVMIFVSYTFRLAPYFIMDEGRCSGFEAMVFSSKAMKGNRFKMFKLDLSFWWFYLLEAVLAVVCYLDVILPALGVTLPFSETVAYFIALALYCVLELALHLWKKADVETTYALAYRECTHPENIPLNPPEEY